VAGGGPGRAEDDVAELGEPGRGADEQGMGAVTDPGITYTRSLVAVVGWRIVAASSGYPKRPDRAWRHATGLRPHTAVIIQHCVQ
jgi:hypothetical protein